MKQFCILIALLLLWGCNGGPEPGPTDPHRIEVIDPGVENE